MSNAVFAGQLLSERESQIVELIVEGLMDKEISRRFGTALGTIKNHIVDIKIKTGCRNRVEIAVRYDYFINRGAGI